ncbi:hypothetical protein C9975_08830 [Thalassospira xiamenensis]|nr:hypothetical protein C9975_08830 [Thalassospira xiamenensis]
MMKRNSTFKAAAIVVPFILAACSTSVPEPETEMGKRLANLEKQQLEMQARQEAREQIKREQEIDLLPSWVENPPESDGTGFYGVGIAQSKHLNHSRKAARLQAEFELAKMYRQELSGSERAFEEGNTDGDVVSQTTFLIDKIVDAVPVVGYEIVDQEIKAHAGQHHTYVLLKLPYEQFNKVLQEQKAAENNDRVQVAFDDLERRLDKRRQQKQAEAEAEHERELEKMKTRSEMMQQQSQDTEAPKGDAAVNRAAN